MKGRIAILTGNHVCHNPRAFKEAEKLSEAGFDVEWLGAWLDPELAERDRLLLRKCTWRFTPVCDWTQPGCLAWLRRQAQRVRRQLGIQLHRFLRIENAWQLGYCARELLDASHQHKANLFIAHSEPALWVARELMRRGHNVGVDMEDWFSEDLLPEQRKGRPVKLLRDLERSLLGSTKHRSCTSHAMSRALASAYACDSPLVIYNAFPWTEREKLDGQVKDRIDSKIPSLHWFSQTIGRGRGLEDLFAALPLIKADLEVHLRGSLTAGNREWLDQLIPRNRKTRVFVHSLVDNDELLSRIAEHDIGLALDPKVPASRNVTITNKILQYLLAGVPTVASDTSGHREIEEQAPGAVFIYESGSAQRLADLLVKLLAGRDQLVGARTAALRAAEQTFCWERIAGRLVKSVELAQSS
jgi:glycosyltransferase involved in cell wall biosynthesis